MPLLLLGGGDAGLSSGSPKGAIHLDEEAKDYRFRIKIDSSGESDSLYQLDANGRLRITWGLPYDAEVTGIEVRIKNWLDGLGTEHHETQLTTPWGNYFEGGSGWLDEFECRVELDDVTLTREANCDFTFEFTELRFYIGDVLKETIEGQTVEGGSFDLREDIVWLQASTQESSAAEVPCLGSTSTAPNTNCGFSFEDAPLFRNIAHIIVEGGWEFWEDTGWAEDEVSINQPALPASDCECVPTMPPVTELFESNDLSVEAKIELEATRAIVGEFRCDCPSGGYFETRLWTLDTHYLKTGSQVGALPETSGISSHAYYAEVDCGVDFDSETSTDAEILTYCETLADGDQRETKRHCVQLLDAFPCFPGEECLPTYDVPDDTQCCTTALRSTLWPVLPSCGTPGCVSLDISDGLRHVRAYLQEGEVFLGLSTNLVPLAYSHFSTGIEGVDCLCIRWHRDSKGQALILMTEESAEIFYRESFDEGTTWSMPTTIGSGSKPAMVIGRNGLRYYYWISGTTIRGEIRDSQNAIVVAEFEAIASGVEDEGLVAGEFFTQGGGHRIELMYVSGGDVTTVTSVDGQVFS